MYNFIKLVIIFLCFLFIFNFAVYGQVQKNTDQSTIAIDLDGVLNNYKKYEKDNIPEIRQGAKEFIQELHNCGYKLILFTNRKPLLASKWLIENDLDKYFIDVTNVKPMAMIYIDDRAINFDGNYNKTIKNIKNFNIYWNKY